MGILLISTERRMHVAKIVLFMHRAAAMPYALHSLFGDTSTTGQMEIGVDL